MSTIGKTLRCNFHLLYLLFCLQALLLKYLCKVNPIITCREWKEEFEIESSGTDNDKQVDFFFRWMVCFDSFGILPGLFIEYVGEKKATIGGGIMIIFAKILIVLFLDE